MTFNPPSPEPKGALALPGFVKMRPEDDRYVSRFRDNPNSTGGFDE